MRTLLAIILLIAGVALLTFDLPAVPPEPEEQCTDCHTDIKKLVETSKFVHPVVARGGCLPCHTAHGPGEKPHLLNNSFPAGMYTKAVSDTFALCWDCHDMDMIAVERTTTVTGFRNGDENMHYVHVSGDRARSCSMCHNMHAAGNTHLVNDVIRFGKWDMKMNFIVQEQGGSCAPGCHGVKEYKR